MESFGRLGFRALLFFPDGTWSTSYQLAGPLGLEFGHMLFMAVSKIIGLGGGPIQVARHGRGLSGLGFRGLGFRGLGFRNDIVEM